jgi:hypothetical protein
MSSKPTFEEVFSVFQGYNIECTRIVNTGKRSTMDAEFKRALEKVKLRLDEIGIGQHIDWTSEQVQP